MLRVSSGEDMMPLFPLNFLLSRRRTLIGPCNHMKRPVVVKGSKNILNRGANMRHG